MTEKVEPSLKTFPQCCYRGRKWFQDFEASELKKQKEVEAALKEENHESDRLEDLFSDMGGFQDYRPYELNAFLRGYKARGRELFER